MDEANIMGSAQLRRHPRVPKVTKIQKSLASNRFDISYLINIRMLYWMICSRMCLQDFCCLICHIFKISPYYTYSNTRKMLIPIFGSRRFGYLWSLLLAPLEEWGPPKGPSTPLAVDIEGQNDHYRKFCGHLLPKSLCKIWWNAKLFTIHIERLFALKALLGV